MTRNKQNKTGLALPLVLTFVVCIMVFASALVYFRKESKQQNLSNLHFLQANFMAQSAIQMMLLKLSAFPQEACDAGVLSLGYCPFRAIIAGSNLNAAGNTGNPQALKEFFSDCNTTRFPWKATSVDSSTGKFSVADFKVISAFTDPGERQLVISAQIKALGEATLNRGKMETRKEEMVKTVKLTRKN